MKSRNVCDCWQRAYCRSLVVQDLPQDHYRVYIAYRRVPPYDEMVRGNWSRVSPSFHDAPKELHASCVGMDQTPDEKVFYLHEAGDDWASEERITWGLKQRSPVAPNGYRPATDQETYEFSEAHPELVEYVGLGSVHLVHGQKSVVHIWPYHDGGRVFGGWSVEIALPRKTRCLFVVRD